MFLSYQLTGTDFNLVLPPPINMTVNAGRTMANGTFEVSITAFNNATNNGRFTLGTEFSPTDLSLVNMSQVNVILSRGNVTIIVHLLVMYIFQHYLSLIIRQHMHGQYFT